MQKSRLLDHETVQLQSVEEQQEESRSSALGGGHRLRFDHISQERPRLNMSRSSQEQHFPRVL
jgi:hypothetical protein